MSVRSTNKDTMGDPLGAVNPVLCSKVFGNDLILEKILSFVVFDGKNLSRRDIAACRLVQKPWLRCVFRALQKLGRPLFTLNFGNWGSPEEGVEQGKVQNFLDTWEIGEGEGNLVFPFKVDFRSAIYFTGAAVREFVNCLVRDGDSVTRVEMCFGHFDGGEMLQLPDIAGEMHLPIVKGIDVVVEEGISRTAARLLQYLLAGTEKLATFKLEGYILNVSPISKMFTSLRLPPTLEKIHLHLKMSSEQVGGLLLGNSLPNLKELHIFLPKVPLGWSGLVFQILHRFRLNLEKLTIECEEDAGDPSEVTFDQLAVMSKLKVLQSYRSRFAWSGKVGNLEKFFPVMKVLHLLFHSASLLQKWMSTSQLDAVKEFHVGVGQSEPEEQFTVQLARQLHATFRHVVDLAIAFPSAFQEAAIRNIFKEMGQLERLSLWMGPTDTGPGFWDSLLLGVTPQFATALRSSPELWEGVHLDHYRLPSPSILNLAALKMLSLNSNYTGVPLISDVVFRFGFLMMPNLRKLRLGGDFEPSEKMVDHWESQNRTFT